MDKKLLVNAISARLKADLGDLKTKFYESGTSRWVVIDDLLPTELAREIAEKFPATSSMRLMESFREKKFTSKQLQNFDPAMRDIVSAFQSPEVIALVESITGMTNQLPDPQLYAGGLSAMTKGHFLNPHIDNSHEGQRRYYRTLNLLYYVSPDWKEDDGGHLELWDEKVRTPTTIHSFFNRLVLMETNKQSWHSVCEVQSSDGVRRCVSNYYFSPDSPDGGEYFHVTSFSARPEQPFRRMWAVVDTAMRTSLRKIVRKGIGREDIYRPT